MLLKKNYIRIFVIIDHFGKDIDTSASPTKTQKIGIHNFFINREKMQDSKLN